MYTRKDLLEVINTQIALVLFKPVVPDLKRLGDLYLAFGVAITWLVGIGRYWDNPRAMSWQYMGFGSIAYIICLALILWLLLMPLKPNNWHYKNILIFLGLTSLPAILYAIPVELLFSFNTAQLINILFLLIVAVWRVKLLISYLRRSAGFSGFTLFVATFLPLVLIITALSFLNLEHAVFNIMGGNQPNTANGLAYVILTLVTLGSWFLSPVLIIGYGVIVWQKNWGNEFTDQ